MEVQNSKSIYIHFFHTEIKPLLKTITSKETLQNIYDKDMTTKIKERFTIEKEKNKNKDLFIDDPIYHFIVAYIKKSKISITEKKQLIRLVVFAFKNCSNPKDKNKIAQQIMALISLKENMKNIHKDKQKKKMDTGYENLHLERYRNKLEESVINSDNNQQKSMNLSNDFLNKISQLDA